MVKFLFYRVPGFVGWAIRTRTWSDYGHVAIEIDGQVYEAMLKGVSKTPREVRDLDSQPDLTLTVDLDIQQIKAMEKWLEAQVGVPYDYKAIWGFLVRRKRANDERWFCSELAYEALKRVGVEPFKRIETYKVSPGLLTYSPVFRGSK